MANSNTSHAFNVPLGYLRGFLVLLVVAHHSALAYAGMPAHAASLGAPPMLWRAFPIIDSAALQGLQIFAGFNDVFFMSLLFLLSGVFVTQSIGHKGRLGFLRGRIVRLGIPFVFAAAILAPLAYLPAYLQINGDSFAGFWTAWRALPVWPSGPAWFI
ncbi:MAG: acyltransferase family protein, partial [Alphaproteobacteria bacterium]